MCFVLIVANYGRQNRPGDKVYFTWIEQVVRHRGWLTRLQTPVIYFCARVTHASTCTRTLPPRLIHKGEQTHELFRGQTAKMTSMRDAALHASGARCAVLRTVARPSSSKKTLPEFILIMSVMLLVPVQPASAHPQCLDFAPPFKPSWHLEFCTQYEEFGCCDQKTDNMIAERYWDIIDQLETAGHELCADMLKEVMCQVNISSSLCAFNDAVTNGFYFFWRCTKLPQNKTLHRTMSTYC